MPELTLRSESAIPLYMQLMERIRADILQSVYPVGAKIPTEHDLERIYGVSRVTVRRALDELTNGGMLEKKQGKGTFVAYPKPTMEHRGVKGFQEACRAQGMEPSVGEIRIREIPAPEEDRLRLQLEPEANIIEIRRVLRADGLPVILETLRFSMAYVWLENANLRGDLYRTLQEFGVRAENSIYDFSLQALTQEDATLLQEEAGRTVMAVAQTVYDQKTRPLHTSHLLVLGEKFVLKI